MILDLDSARPGFHEGRASGPTRETSSRERSGKPASAADVRRQECAEHALWLSIHGVVDAGEGALAEVRGHRRSRHWVRRLEVTASLPTGRGPEGHTVR